MIFCSSWYRPYSEVYSSWWVVSLVICHCKLDIEYNKKFKIELSKRELKTYYAFFYKKLGCGHGTKSFLISHDILSILVLKVS